ncbi:MAG: glycoside hydrolase family 95 protein, partial [Clostridia bacterium]|nr:glycoside hydrolase family 95 protein [Clostridia bacterium]
KMISEAGKDTAKKLYDAMGWVIHHTTDIFGRTGIHDSGDVGFFPMAAPWLCLNLWEKFEFENDIEFLKDSYPIFKGACEFLLDFLTEDNKGNLVTNPSNSPENKFYYNQGGEITTSFFTYGATIDFEIIYAIFTRMIYACELLGKDAELAEQMKFTLSKLPPLKISRRYGTICEWIEDYEEVEPGHRHISHLFGLYPADQINETNPEIFEAAKRTIERRTSHGGGATGWSRAWIINFYARLKDGNVALDNLKYLMSNSTAENLFDMHPPFQIDGNFGSIAGISEMLLQSHLGEPGTRIIEFLPALPDEWKNGSISGIKARGNFEISINWANGKASSVSVLALCDNDFRFKQNQRSSFVSADLPYAETDGIISIHMKNGEMATINFK